MTVFMKRLQIHKFIWDHQNRYTIGKRPSPLITAALHRCFGYELDLKNRNNSGFVVPEVVILWISKNYKYDSIELGLEIFQLPGFMGEFCLIIDLVLDKTVNLLLNQHRSIVLKKYRHHLNIFGYLTESMQQNYEQKKLRHTLLVLMVFLKYY